jgi:hypothetical protein
VTSVAVVVSFPLVVAGHARLHSDWFLLHEHVLPFDLGVAGRTGNLGFAEMPLVREGHKVGQAIESRPRYGLFSLEVSGQRGDSGTLCFYSDVTVHTERLARYPRLTTSRRAFMAFRAFQTELRVRTMAERKRLRLRHSNWRGWFLLSFHADNDNGHKKHESNHGRANATKASPAGLFRRPPPTATTTYCLPFTL